jgi:plastocyanin
MRNVNVRAVLVVCFVAVASVAASCAQAQGVGPATTIAVRLTRAGASVDRSTVPAGTVVFRVTNRDTRTHRFSLIGNSTITIPAGKTARLELTFSRPGSYPYSSTAPGRSLFRSVLNVVTPCTTPTASTVMVQLAQGNGGLSVSQTAIPCGQVTFVVSDTGTLPDNLHIFSEGPGPRASTPELAPGQTATATVELPYKGLVHIESGDYPPSEPEFGGDYGEEAQLTIE